MFASLHPVAAFEWTTPPSAFAGWEELWEAFAADLPTSVEIQPSENVFYFRFWSSNLPFQGCFSLRLREGREPKLTFSYTTLPVGNNTRIGHHQTLGAEHGVSLTRRNQLHFRADLQGRTIDIHLNRLHLQPPKRSQLATTEIYVGPSYDESGLEFSLLFDQLRCQFLWILNDDQSAADVFAPFEEGLSIGERTGFVFVNERAMGRQLLVGVSRKEVRANTYYDGPFDQLPDNYIDTGEVELRAYIHLAEPDRRGQIDKFGYYRMLRGSRVAITPYRFYNSLSEFQGLAPNAQHHHIALSL